jgi:hypothetical protein
MTFIVLLHFAFAVALPSVLAEEYHACDGDKWRNATSGKSEDCGVPYSTYTESCGNGTYRKIKLTCDNADGIYCYQILGAVVKIGVEGNCIRGDEMLMDEDEIELVSEAE